ncbi:MAG: hypothetical protein RBS39_09615 [Phycisphaerales bacterium]|jgi:hypothetical protein|nr:hypothetical protein [Phycisphaerales bacterium]
MVIYMFLPLHMHADDGYGAVADAFHNSADQLNDAEGSSSLFNRMLPVCYLYRHAIELYLKSACIILNRHFGSDPKSVPQCQPAGTSKPRPIDKVHSVQALWDCLCDLLKASAESLRAIDKCLVELPPATSGHIATIEKHDARSDYFRYPMSRSDADDAAKSSMKPIGLDELMEQSTNNPASVFALVGVDDQKVPQAAWSQQNQEVESLLAVLREVSGFLHGFHAATRALLTEHR